VKTGRVQTILWPLDAQLQKAKNYRPEVHDIPVELENEASLPGTSQNESTEDLKTHTKRERIMFLKWWDAVAYATQ